jgi:hypothetical protein
VLLQLRPLCAGLLPSKAEIDLTELVRTDPSTPERLRTAVERERSVNLPIQLAHLLLEDLATVEPSDPYYRAGVRTLLRIQAILVERADISAVDWLLDELDRHASIDELDRRAIKDALGESLTPQWFARLRGASDPTQRALAALVLRMPPAAVGPLLEAIALDEFPVLRAMTAAFID